MALATRCPHCDTIFRVAQDQLKLRAGLVRCGFCKQIFNGTEHLVQPGATSPPAPADKNLQDEVRATGPTADMSAADEQLFSAVPPTVEVPYIEPVTPAAPEPVIVPAKETEASWPEPLPDESSPAEPEVTAASIPDEAPGEVVDFFDLDEFLKPVSTTHGVPDNEGTQTGPAATAPEQPVPQGVGPGDVEIEAAAEPTQPLVDRPADAVAFVETTYIDELPVEPAPAILATLGDLRNRKGRPQAPAVEEPATTEEDEPEEPAFVRQARRKQRMARVMRAVMGFGSFILLICFVLQGSYVFRDQLSVRFPQTKPALTKLCTVLGCNLDLPTQIDAVSIESTELQTLTTRKNTLVLTALLRNHSAVVQAWPHVELTLNDANERPVARRIFLPREYLPTPPDVSKGFMANSERSLNIYFELSQLKASGYKVGVFYP